MSFSKIGNQGFLQNVQKQQNISRIHLKIFFIYNASLTNCIIGMKIKLDPQASEFSLRAVRDSVLPVIQPLVTAGSHGCGSIKNFFGLTYNQMQAKNFTLDDFINFDLITKNGNVKYDLKPNEKLKKMIHSADRIVVLTHGFMESSDGEMVQALSAELLKKPGWKIFALDGRKTINLEYLRSSTYARFMGEMLGKFLSQLIKDGQDPSNVGLIGHSLGAHIGGIAGKQVFQLTGKRLGRITGLDPAGPCFQNVSLDDRLDPTDAEYVDVIHTNAGILGLKEPVGHKDFYPSGGSSQPGCYFYICDHSRAWELYAESIAAPKAFPAQKCENWQLFQEGKCNKTETVHMGIESNTGSAGKYFLTTKPSKPFGIVPVSNR